MPDDDPHGKFRKLCMLYGDFNRAVFLDEILKFIAGFGATTEEHNYVEPAPYYAATYVQNLFSVHVPAVPLSQRQGLGRWDKMIGVAGGAGPLRIANQAGLLK